MIWSIKNSSWLNTELEQEMSKYLFEYVQELHKSIFVANLLLTYILTVAFHFVYAE